MNRIEVMKLALEALEKWSWKDTPMPDAKEAITALRQAIEQPADEPVAWWHFNKGFDHCMTDRLNEAAKQNPAPLYTQPQEFVCSTGLCRYRKPLTDEQIADFFGVKSVDESFVEFARAIEAAHGITGEQA